MLSLLKDYAKWLIKFSLCFSIGTNVLLFCISVIYGRIFEGAFIFGVIALILSCYAKAVWHRIPYAASNLKSAVTALRTNLGVAILGFAAFLITIGWICLWVPAMLGTVIHFRTYETTDDNSVNFGTSTSTGTVLALLLLLSFYWTTQVIRVRSSAVQSYRRRCNYCQVVPTNLISISYFAYFYISRFLPILRSEHYPHYYRWCDWDLVVSSC